MAKRPPKSIGVGRKDDVAQKGPLPRDSVLLAICISLGASTAVAACDPNYDPCVPVASDVDCASGSGNGPAYVDGPVHVIGSDIYDLDRDGDDVGCE